MPRYGTASKAVLANTCRELQLVAQMVIKAIDCSATESTRDRVRQEFLYADGKTQVKWPNSKHNKFPADALHLIPWPNNENREEYTLLAGHVKMAFHSLKAQGLIAENVVLVWGGDWDGDNDLDDNNFDDLGHFEVIRK